MNLVMGGLCGPNSCEQSAETYNGSDAKSIDDPSEGDQDAALRLESPQSSATGNVTAKTGTRRFTVQQPR